LRMIPSPEISDNVTPNNIIEPKKRISSGTSGLSEQISVESGLDKMIPIVKPLKISADNLQAVYERRFMFI